MLKYQSPIKATYFFVVSQSMHALNISANVLIMYHDMIDILLFKQKLYDPNPTVWYIYLKNLIYTIGLYWLSQNRWNVMVFLYPRANLSHLCSHGDEDTHATLTTRTAPFALVLHSALHTLFYINSWCEEACLFGADQSTGLLCIRAGRK